MADGGSAAPVPDAGGRRSNSHRGGRRGRGNGGGQRAHGGGSSGGRGGRGEAAGRSARWRPRRGGGRGSMGAGAQDPIGARAIGEQESVDPDATGTDGAGHGGGAELSSRAVSEGSICIICAEVLDSHMHRPGVGPCGHQGTCGLCFMRLRLLLGEQACTLCKTPLEHVYIFDSPTSVRPYSSLQIWGNNAGPGMVHDERSGIFMPRAFHTEVFLAVQAPKCTVAGCGHGPSKSVAALQQHMRDKHELHFCDVCLSHKKVFLAEQVQYTKAELEKHMEKGDPSQGVVGHPPCRFCKASRFYDTTALYTHLQREHYTCDMCERAGIRHRYFRDYKELERHFRAEHFLCEDPRCLERRFVAFADALDLQAHRLAEHPEQGASRRVEVSFKVRRQQGEGGAGGGQQRRQSDAGARVEDNEELGEVEQATAPSEWTPARQGLSLQDPSAFPELSSEATRAASTRVFLGPSASAVAQAPPPRPQDADFPPLGSTTATSSIPGSSHLRGPVRRPPPAPAPSQVRTMSRLPPRDSSVEGQLERNKRFAEALGLGGPGPDRGRGDDPLRAYQFELEKPTYPRDLLQWAAQRKVEVQRLEVKLEAFLKDERNASLHLKPMPRDDRRLVHLLAEFYGLQTISYDSEPHRYVALIKQPGTRPAVPVMLLSEASQEAVSQRVRQQGRSLVGKPPGPSIVISHLAQNVTGKQALDILNRLCPGGLDIVGYRYENSAGAGDPYASSTQAPVLVVELGSVQAALALLDRVRSTPEILPFRVKRGDGVPSASSSSDPPAPPTMTTLQEKGGGVQQGVGGDGGDGGANGSNSRWAHSALKGKLAPRTVPLAASAVPVSSSSAVDQAAEKLRMKEEKGAARRKERRQQEEDRQLRAGEGLVANRWQGLLVDDEDDEQEAGGSTGGRAEGDHTDDEEDEEEDEQEVARRIRQQRRGPGDAWGDEEPLPPVKWACRRCTFLNNADTAPSTCAVCGTGRL